MKNIFKILFVFLIGIFCTYIVWAVGSFIFAGEWLGVITIDEGSIAFTIVSIIVIVLMFINLDETTYYD